MGSPSTWGSPWRPPVVPNDAFGRTAKLAALPELSTALGLERPVVIALHLMVAGPAGSASIAADDGSILAEVSGESPARLSPEAPAQQPDFDEYFHPELPWIHWVPKTIKTAWLGDPRVVPTDRWTLRAHGY